jgi:ribosomal protein S18 acetylase RimI-like enzyme
MGNFEIIEVDYNNPKQLEAIGKLHGEVLPESNVPGLGPLFTKYFYYSVLPKRDLINCFLAMYDGKAVGMIVGTKKPASLISLGMKGNMIKIAFILGLSILSKPSRLKSLINQLKHKEDPLQKEYEDRGDAYEIVTIGVLEEFRQMRFEDGKKIANRLAEHAYDYYRKLGYKYMIGQILKSNMAPIKFWAKYNGKFIDSTVRDIGGIVVVDLYNLGIPNK